METVRGTSVIKYSSWLTAFLSRRSLKQPDQRPLYEYHVSNEEYGDLKRVLSELGNMTDLTKDKSSSACFTLFCAEWYRREYERDYGWSWDQVWSSLGFSFNATELRQVVPTGLEAFWGRPIRIYEESERRNFLGSVFSEGGLPFRVLKQSDSRFQSVFSRVLKQYESAQLLGYTTRQLVTNLIEQSGLPQVFSEDTSVELVAQMADELVSIVHLYGLDAKDDSVKELDAVSPQWRERFPIPLDEETGNDFLNGLLHSASVQTRSQRATERRWDCKHFFSNQNTDNLQTEISFPKEVTFNLNSEPTSCRFELAIYEGEKQLLGLGASYAVLDNKRAKVRLKHKFVTCKRHSPNEELTLVALSGGAVLAAIPIQNTMLSLGEVPLGFEFVNEQWQLIGQASFRTKCSSVLFLLPNNSKFDVGEGQYTDHDNYLGCKTVKVEGRCIVNIINEEIFRIRIGDLTSANLTLDLKGDVLKWACTPSLTYLGVPTVEWINSDPVLGEKGANIHLSGKLLDTCPLQERLGRHYLSVRNNDNETLLRKRIGILPADFKIKLKKGERSNQGSILFFSTTPCLYQLETSNVNSRRVRHDDCTELSLEVDGLPPAYISIFVTPNLESTPIRINLPFPASGYLGFDKDEQPLPRSLPISELLGARVYLFGRADHSITKYQMELSLKGATASNARYTWFIKVNDKPAEVSIFNLKGQIESLLSLQTGIDQIVELTIDNNIVCNVGRYAVEMQHEFDRRLLFSSINISKRGKLPKPMLMLLGEPERYPIELVSRKTEGVAIGEFELPDIIDKMGPWLIVPKLGSSVAFRPVFLAGNTSLSDPNRDVRSLQKAVQVFNPRESFNSFEPVLNAMACDPGHSGWQFLKVLYDSYGYLPLPTFEVWRALVRNPSALAMALFKFEMSIDFLSRIEAEFPFIWELFPILEIKNSADRLKHYLLKKGIGEAFVPELIKKMYRRLGDAIPSYNGNIEQWLNDGCIPKEIQMPEEVMKHVVSTWYQDLIRVRSDESWPEFGGKRLKKWCLSQKDSLIAIEPEMDYRNAIVYLPVFSASVAAGQCKFEDVFVDSADAIFFLRQVRDFDNQWFVYAYQYYLLRCVTNKNKELEFHD